MLGTGIVVQEDISYYALLTYKSEECQFFYHLGRLMIEHWSTITMILIRIQAWTHFYSISYTPDLAKDQRLQIHPIKNLIFLNVLDD